MTDKETEESLNRVHEAGPKILSLIAKELKTTGEAVVTLCRLLACLRGKKVTNESIHTLLDLAFAETDATLKSIGFGDIQDFCDKFDATEKVGVN